MGKTGSHKSLIKCYKNFTSNPGLIFIVQTIYWTNKYKCAVTKIISACSIHLSYICSFSKIPYFHCNNMHWLNVFKKSRNMYQKISRVIYFTLVLTVVSCVKSTRFSVLLEMKWKKLSMIFVAAHADVKTHLFFYSAWRHVQQNTSCLYSGAISIHQITKAKKINNVLSPKYLFIYISIHIQ